MGNWKFFLASKWVYESTEMIPHKKKESKPFRLFLRKVRKFARFEPYILDFQAFQAKFLMLLLIYYSLIMCNCSVIVLTRYRAVIGLTVSAKT